MRTNFTKIEYDKEREPLSIPKKIMEQLLRLDRPGDCIALYVYYYYRAKWREGKADLKTTKEQLQWSEEKTQKIKNILMKNGFIQSVQIRENGQIIAHKIILTTTRKNHYLGNRGSGSPKLPINKEDTRNNEKNGFLAEGYILNKGKDFNKNINIIPAAATTPETRVVARGIAKEFIPQLERKRFANFSPQQKGSWTITIQSFLSEGVDADRIREALNWYIDHFGEQFVPVILNATDFRKKYLSLEKAMKREPKKKFNQYKDSEKKYKQFDLEL